jgi:hypothetical protein
MIVPDSNNQQTFAWHFLHLMAVVGLTNWIALPV